MAAFQRWETFLCVNTVKCFGGGMALCKCTTLSASEIIIKNLKIKYI